MACPHNLMSLAVVPEYQFSICFCFLVFVVAAAQYLTQENKELNNIIQNPDDEEYFFSTCTWEK